MKTILITILTLFTAVGVHAAGVTGSLYELSNETALAYSKNFDYDSNDINARKISAQVTYTSATLAAATFTDGQTSSGTLTVLSTTSLLGTRISVNGVYFSFGRVAGYPNDTLVAVGANVDASAANLANKIGAHPSLSAIISTSVTAGQIDLVSKLADGIDYPITTSKPLVVSKGGDMDGGIAATVAISDVITIAATSFTTGLKVALTGSNLPTGLTATDYWVIKLTDNTIKLASSKANALLGTPVNITAVTVDASANTYTLTPAAITGTPSFKWQVSNDGIGWADLNTSSVTMSAYTLGGLTSIWDMVEFNHRWLRLNVTGPTTGGILLRTTLNRKD